MYSGSGYSEWEIGDIDVIIHDGQYHLFHLIIPNHDYIAHAVSNDGIQWRRTKNALFVGHPGQWDDDMLWTMHVTRDEEYGFVMHYTGLHRAHQGVKQCIGIAVSADLVHWEKKQERGMPFGSEGPYYEDELNRPREWMSFRDPYRYIYNGEEYLMMCARTQSGPVSRRGCVGLAKRIDGEFKLQEPLFVPFVYDDVECPSAIEINGRYYLIGSIRENIKVQYWFAEDFLGEYHCFHSNVLLPQGNYAARIVKDREYTLIYNFYYASHNINLYRVMIPPKQISVDGDGRLILKSFYRWEEKITRSFCQDDMPSPRQLFQNSTASADLTREKWSMSSRSGYEVFAFQKISPSFIWEGILSLEGLGKCGFVFDCDKQANGYYISIDFVNGFAQIRRWSFNPSNTQKNFNFEELQSNHFDLTVSNRSLYFKLIRYGHYIELSINDSVKLTLIDYLFTGDYVGVYAASAKLSLSDTTFHCLAEPEDEYASQETQVEKFPNP